MAALTDAAAERVLAWLTGQSTTAPSTPLMIALLTALGNDTSAGTEVNGTGNGYVRKPFTPGAVTTTAGVTQVKNVSLIRFDNMPAVTVVGFAVYDSAGIPFRWATAPLASPRTFVAGDPAEFAIGELIITAD